MLLSPFTKLLVNQTTKLLVASLKDRTRPEMMTLGLEKKKLLGGDQICFFGPNKATRTITGISFEFPAVPMSKR